MTDFLTWSPISLGRWFGTAVRVHISLIVFVVYRMIDSAVSLAYNGDLRRFPATACWLGLLLLALALHELAHALTAYWLDCDQEGATSGRWEALSAPRLCRVPVSISWLHSPARS